MEIIFGVKVTSFNLVSSVSFGVTLSSYRDYHYKFLVFASNHGAEEEQQYIEYPDQKKGIFLANDTYANMFLNLIFQKYGTFPSTYEIVGFDDSPIASEAILPITTVGQQIDVIAKTAMDLLVRQMHSPDSEFIRTEVQFIPAKLTVIDHYRETYECRSCRKASKTVCFLSFFL